MRMTGQVLRAQAAQAEADRMRLLDKPIPRGLSPLCTLQMMLWGWCDTRARSKTKWVGGTRDDYSYGDLAVVADEFLGAATGGSVMILGKRKTISVAYDPIVKFDARNGTITRCDRVQEKNGEWATKPHAIAIEDFEAVPDVPGIQVGYLCFTPPDFKLVPLGQDYGDPPSDKHKEGFRIRMLLRNGSGSGVHELSSTAVGLWESLNELCAAYDAACGKHKGELPVVGVAEMVRTTTKSGTNYRPIFEITGWVVTPKELITPAAGPQGGKKKKPAKDDLDQPINIPSASGAKRR
jgi:hypothetical protein